MSRHFIPVSKPDISDTEINSVIEVLRSGWWTTGSKVSEFESKIAEYLTEADPLYALAVNSCTAGLFLSLSALGIKRGDEVIVPTWTFAATAQVVDWLGAVPVLCDIDADSLNIDVKKAAQLVTSKTKAIIPVHIGGFPCDIEGVKRLAREHNLKIIEDAAHAIGAKYKGRKVGNFSDTTVFSFYATKNLSMGEGGLVVSRDNELIERMRRLSYFGINKQAFKRYEKGGSWFYDIEGLGYKFNLDNIHAAIGLAQLARLDQMNSRRREIAKIYRERLKDTFDFTKDSPEHFHVYHLFALKIRGNVLDRDKLIAELNERDIGTSIHYMPLHLHSFYKHRFKKEDFPVANELFKRIFSIPMFPSLSDDDVGYIVSVLNELCGRQDG